MDVDDLGRLRLPENEHGGLERSTPIPLDFYTNLCTYTQALLRRNFEVLRAFAVV